MYTSGLNIRHVSLILFHFLDIWKDFAFWHIDRIESKEMLHVVHKLCACLYQKSIITDAYKIVGDYPERMEFVILYSHRSLNEY